MPSAPEVSRRDFLKTGGIISAGLVLGKADLWAQEQQKQSPPPRPTTNIQDALKIPKTKHSLPGAFPGKVVEVFDDAAVTEARINAEAVGKMFDAGVQQLTGKNLADSFKLFFTKDDIVGIKVNPVGPGLISTRLELVDDIIHWLTTYGLPKKNIVIWDRFDYMLRDAGFTAERFPGVQIEGLQTMDEAAAEGKADNSRWLDKDGKHISLPNFDPDVYYWADTDAPQDMPYLNQHVVNTKYSYFGKLITQKLTKIINVPVFKNTGNGISMATKNLGYAAVCNTGRLHRPLFFDVCTEVLAFPAVRDKLVLNITDGLRAQYDGGPDANTQFIWDYKRIFFATDPFALDMTCHNKLVEKRKEMQITVNEHPRFTEYLRYAQSLDLGIADPAKIEFIKV